MAQQFTCPTDGCSYIEWAEDEADLIESAREHLETHDRSLGEDEIGEHTRTIPSPKRIKASESAVMDERRRRAGERAAAELDIEDGMTVGLGTGSTTAWAIAGLEEQIDDGLDISGVATSYQSHELAKEVGIPLVGLDEATEIDVAIDGADQFSDRRPDVVKGGGAAHAREKVIDTAAERLVIATDAEKAADPLDHPIPVSVLPDARTLVAERVRELDGTPELRYAERKDGPLVTDNGNFVLDCDFGPIENTEERARQLASIPGVVDHGLFVGLVDEVYVGSEDGVERVEF